MGQEGHDGPGLLKTLCALPIFSNNRYCKLAKLWHFYETEWSYIQQYLVIFSKKKKKNTTENA